MAGTIGGRIVAHGARCTVAGGATAQLEQVGPRQVRCVAFDGAALPPFTVEVAALSASIARGADDQAVISLAGDARPGPGLWLVAGPGLTLADVHRTATGFTVAVHGAAAGPGRIDLRDRGTGIRLATLDWR